MSGTAASRRADGISFALLLPLLLAAQPVATDSYLPALPAIAREMGAVSATLTVFVLCFGLGQLPCGPLADRFGRRPVLLTGLACYTLAAIGCVLANGVPMLVVCRGLQGFSMAAVLVCARAAVRDLYPAHEGPHVMARGLTGLGLVALVAPLAGAAIVQWYGWRWVLGGMALYAAVLWALCARHFHETRVRAVAGAPAAPKGSLREVFASQRFRAWTSVAASTYGGIFCFLLFSPMVYIDYLGMSPTLYGWIPAGGSLIYVFSTTMCRRLLHRVGAVRAVQIGSLLSVTGPMLQALGCWLLPMSAWPLLLGHAVFVLGHGIHQPCGQAGAVGDLPQLAGRAVSWSGFWMMLVAFVVGQIAATFVEPGHIHGAWPMVVPMWLAGVSLVLIAYLWLPRLQVPRHPQPRKDSSS